MSQAMAIHRLMAMVQNRHLTILPAHLLNSISRKVFWIDQGRIRVCPGGYKAFDEWSEAIIEQEARELQNMQKKLAAEVDWTQGGVTGRRKRVPSYEKKKNVRLPLVKNGPPSPKRGRRSGPPSVPPNWFCLKGGLLMPRALRKKLFASNLMKML